MQPANGTIFYAVPPVCSCRNRRKKSSPSNGRPCRTIPHSHPFQRAELFRLLSRYPHLSHGSTPLPCSTIYPQVHTSGLRRILPLPAENVVPLRSLLSHRLSARVMPYHEDTSLTSVANKCPAKGIKYWTPGLKGVFGIDRKRLHEAT